MKNLFNFFVLTVSLVISTAIGYALWDMVSNNLKGNEVSPLYHWNTDLPCIVIVAMMFAVYAFIAIMSIRGYIIRYKKRGAK